MAGFTIFVSASLAYLPAYEIPLYPFAYWFESVYCLILVYIIVRHRMLDIETVLHKTLLWLSTSVLAFVPVAASVYFLHSALVGLQRFAFVAVVLVLVGASIWLYSLLQPRIDHLFQRKKHGYREALDRFMEVAITMNDREKLAQATRDTIGGTIYALRVRCFWASQNVFRESAGTSSPAPMDLTLGDGLVRHMIRHRELIERDLLAMLLFTDGVTEAVQGQRGAGDARRRPEMFGQGRLEGLLADMHRDSIQTVKARLVSALEAFCCNDDVTFLLVQRTC